MNNLITIDQLEEMISGATDRMIEDFYNPICQTLEKYQINTRKRIAGFIAQISHESGSLHFTEEIWGPTQQQLRYDDPESRLCKELGNDKSEAFFIANLNDSLVGKFYKGHGLIQITGYSNHKAVGKALKIDCVHSPRMLCLPEYAALSAGWFWTTHLYNGLNCNKLMDDDLFSETTRIINGGLSGNTHRLKFYRHNLEIIF